jgi:hypothetical protein
MPHYLPNQLDTPTTAHCTRCGAAMRATIRALVAADGIIRCPICATLHCLDPRSRLLWTQMVAAARRGDLHAWLARHPTLDGTGQKR